VEKRKSTKAKAEICSRNKGGEKAMNGRDKIKPGRLTKGKPNPSKKGQHPRYTEAT